MVFHNMFEIDCVCACCELSKLGVHNIVYVPSFFFDMSLVVNCNLIFPSQNGN